MVKLEENSNHRHYQKEVIAQIEKQIANNTIDFSTVAPVGDYERDVRLCLTGVHIPSEELKRKVEESVIAPLQAIAPEHFYYPHDSLHMTVKNVRVINDPPHFTEKDIKKAAEVFALVIPQHRKFNVYFYRLLLFPGNLALVGTTDPELDNIILDLDKHLNERGIPDEKKYLNDRYFFSNMTLARFTSPISDEFRRKVLEMSDRLSFEPYEVNSVTLLTANAVLKNRAIIGIWKLEQS